MRLQKYLALCGVASRRHAEEMIAQGMVQVNGQTIREMGVQVEDGDIVCVHGECVQPETEKRYVLYHKPMGEVTTVSDPKGRDTVMDHFRDYPVRLYPIGRLDYDSEGLLLLTNDGDLVNGLTHPRHEVEKHYEVRVRGNMDNIPRLSEPMELDGYAIRPAGVTVLERGEDSAKIRMTIHEGRNRQIRRMCEKAGLEVRRLKRVAIGDMPLDPKLKSGAWRELTQDELAYLQDLCAGIEE